MNGKSMQGEAFVPKEEIDLFSMVFYLESLQKKVTLIAAFFKAQSDPKDKELSNMIAMMNECESQLESLATYARRFSKKEGNTL